MSSLFYVILIFAKKKTDLKKQHREQTAFGIKASNNPVYQIPSSQSLFLYTHNHEIHTNNLNYIRLIISSDLHVQFHCTANHY